MNRKYGTLFLVCGVLPWISLLAGDHSVWGCVLYALVSVMFLGLSAVYFANRPAWLGKRPDGRIAAWAWVIWWPYLAVNLAVMWMLSRLSTQLPIAEVVPNLFFGRRLSASERKMFSGDHILDLTAEFAEPRGLRTRAGYSSLPILDATAPRVDQLRSAMEWLDTAISSGPTFVHCAQGHGRTACVILAYLVSRGCVASIADGLQLLRQYRPNVQINRDQHRRLEEFLQ